MSPEILACFLELCRPAALRPLVSGLARRFPGLCAGQVEDAVQNATLSLLRSPRSLPSAWDRAGPAGVERALVVASWRACLRTLRRGPARHEIALPHAGEALVLEDPEALLLSLEAGRRLDELLGSAARRFGGRRPEALRAALRERLGGAGTDGEVASRHGLTRERLNRARCWLAEQLPRA